MTTLRRRATGRITLDEVAHAAGVSPITASRALRGQRSVDPALVARVREAAERLGYVPDPAARALASARSSQVVVLVPMLSNNLFVDLLEAVHATLLPAGYQTLIGVTHYDPGEEEQLLRGYMAHRPAGLLLTGFDRTEGSRRLIESSGVPCVHVMETSEAPGVHSVGFSQAAAGYAMTRHLVERGRRRVMFIGAQLDPRTLQRLQGYRDALRGAGLYDEALELLDPRRSSMALGAELFERALREHEEADALFFCNDDLAQGGLLAALRLGVPVPQRVAVAGFNDLAGSDQMLPPLTTVHTPREEIGRQAAAMLLQLMQGQSVPRPAIDVGCTLVVRGST
ncbi:substrate-binding domain-containing protein [Azohydromonas caseinilytica]|uniref:Substrate-binding domain-containing protein n=1 Tax=Azohydromonas caseinilytica TaxID=2728836 RepID=A0A848F769_9BURK|nr:substrate-binding domain-containing protein [Azohydromonas caseinilytica]NML14586.1 substrate-binding domain-containing protein [Azohydromonas caseinilytica]